MWDPNFDEDSIDETKILITEILLYGTNSILVFIRDEFSAILKIILGFLILRLELHSSIVSLAQVPIIQNSLPKIWMIYILLMGIQIVIMETTLLLTSIIIVPINHYFHANNLGQIRYLFWEYIWVIFSCLIISIAFSLTINQANPLNLIVTVFIMGTLSYLVEILDQIIPYPPILVLEIEEEEIK